MFQVFGVFPAELASGFHSVESGASSRSGGLAGGGEGEGAWSSHGWEVSAWVSSGCVPCTKFLSGISRSVQFVVFQADFEGLVAVVVFY